MANIFVGKNNQPYSASVLEVNTIVKTPEILSNYSMIELDSLYKKFFGDYSYNYKTILSEKIKVHDSSAAVNSFIFQGKEYWLDKATRVGLMHLANCSTDDLQLVLDDLVLSFSPDFVKEFLAKLEVYAGQCYVQTQRHLMAVKELNIPEEILNYDYTTGYPDKIVLE